MDYVSERVFSEYIINVSSLSVSGSVKYGGKDGTTYKVNEKFTYKYDDEGTLDCVAVSTGLKYSGTTNNILQNFYMSTLYIKVKGYVSECEIPFNIDENTKEYASFTVETFDGKTTTYKFYRITDAVCYFTVNGAAGEFYVDTNEVNRLMMNAVRASNGYEIDTSVEYPTPPDNFKTRLDGEKWEI